MAVGFGGRHFYVNELCRLADKSLVIPIRWIIRAGEMCCDAWTVELTSVSSFW